MGTQGRLRRLTVQRAMVHGYLLAGAVYVVGVALGMFGVGADAAQFYTHRYPNPYDVTDYASLTGFYYSPPIALVLWPLTQFGLPIFSAIITGLGLLALLYLLRHWAWLGLLIVPIWWDITGGNISTILAAAIVIGFRYPAAWGVVMLTKVTPGVGAVWFLVRRDWEALIGILSLTGLTFALTAYIAPGLWDGWIVGLLGNRLDYVGPGHFTIEVPLLVRLPWAAAVVVVAAFTGRRWLVPIAAFLATPVLWWSTIAILVACVPLWRQRDVAVSGTIPRWELAMAWASLRRLPAISTRGASSSTNEPQ